MASKLVALRGPLAGKSFELAEATLTLGRGTANTVVLASREASRSHAQIRRQGPAYVLVDQGSSNGTLVNGQKVTSHQLQSGDEVVIGDEAFRFEQDSEGPLMRLVALQGPLSGQRFELHAEPLTLGRSATSAVVIASREASRNHAQISRQGAAYVLADQGSSNGTFVNGQPVTSHPLRHGDRIAIGDEVFVFEQVPAVAPPRPATPAPAAPPATPTRASASTPPSSGAAGSDRAARPGPAAPGAAYGIRCPVCNRVIEPHYQHCPWDGASLANGKTVYPDPPAGSGKS